MEREEEGKEPALSTHRSGLVVFRVSLNGISEDGQTERRERRVSRKGWDVKGLAASRQAL